MIEQPCPGPCNRRWRETHEAFEKALDAWYVAAEVDPDAAGEPPEEPDTNPRSGEPIWCPACTASVRRCLYDIDEQMALRLIMTDGYEVGCERRTERVQSSRAPASPSPGQDDLDDVVRWLRSWEDTYRGTQDWPTAPYRGVASPALTATIAWLGGHLDAILAHPDLSTEFGREVLREHSRLQRLTSTRPPMKHKPLPCPRCKRRSLFLHDDETVRCQSSESVDCGRIMTAKEYGEYEDEATGQQAAS